MNYENFDLELDILQAKLENAKVYTEMYVKEHFGADALAYKLNEKESN